MTLSFVQYYDAMYTNNCIRFPHRQNQIAHLNNLQPEYVLSCTVHQIGNFSFTFNWLTIIMAIKHIQSR